MDNDFSIPVSKIQWVRDCAVAFANWLILTCPDGWKKIDFDSQFVYRRTVEMIVYESLFLQSWRSSFFQLGVQAFGLIALESEQRIKVRIDNRGDETVECDSLEYTLMNFLAGESLDYRHDPGFNDLSWDPVSAVGHLLSTYHIY